jgi:hypothetical protein
MISDIIIHNVNFTTIPFALSSFGATALTVQFLVPVIFELLVYLFLIRLMDVKLYTDIVVEGLNVTFHFPKSKRV